MAIAIGMKQRARKAARVIVIVVLLAIGYGAYEIFLSPPRAGALTEVRIDEGSGAREVAERLQASGIIRSAFAYRALAILSFSARHPRSGAYAISKGTNLLAIARRLALGPVRTERQLRIIEGWTLEDETRLLREDARVAEEKIMRLMGASRNGSSFDPSLREEFVFLRALPVSRSLEGYLFPDTYRVWDDELPDALARKQLREFDQRFGRTAPSAKSAPLATLDQVVTLASIVEKEVQSPEDRRLVAGIFLRRMKEGMPLQSDATLTYITGSARGRATKEELQLDSPYNSYAYRGLPPSPICQPSEDAIRAVLDPTPSRYRYFLTDMSGKVFYAATLEEHAQNRRMAGY